MMKRHRMRIALILLTLIAVVPGGRYAAADDGNGGFGLRSLLGGWGFTASGSIGDVPAAAVGRLTFDGRGGCTNVAILNFGGTLIPLATNLPGGVCTYTVNPDGTGHLDQVFIDPTNAPSSFPVNIIIVDNRKEFRFIVDNPDVPTVGSGVAKRQQGRSD